jgi:hypothetical protein
MLEALYSLLESSFWVLAALVCVYYGDGENDMITVVLSDKRIRRCES